MRGWVRSRTGPPGSRAGALRDERAHGVGERLRRVAEVVGAAEAHEPRPTRDEPPAEQAGKLVEVDVEQRQAMAELALADREAAVADRALVDRAARAHSASPPSVSATRTALATPSSWKPQPQYAPQKCVRSRPLISPWRRCAAWPAEV